MSNNLQFSYSNCVDAVMVQTSSYRSYFSEILSKEAKRTPKPARVNNVTKLGYLKVFRIN